MKRWQRKDTIFWAIVVAIGVGSGLYFVERRHRMAEGLVRNPPWLMWGGTQQITLASTGSAGGSVTRGGQLVRIAYKRPENWRFFFSSRITQVDPAATDGSAIVSFDLTIGVGRSTITIPAFEQFQFNWAATPPGPPTQLTWSVSVNGPTRIAGQAAQNVVDHIVSEDIQLAARIEWFTTQGSVAVPLAITMEVTSYWAPEVHIRPEWFKGKMGQQEDEGR